jgi:hypothetical protein
VFNQVFQIGYGIICITTLHQRGEGDKLTALKAHFEDCLLPLFHQLAEFLVPIAGKDFRPGDLRCRPRAFDHAS